METLEIFLCTSASELYRVIRNYGMHRLIVFFRLFGCVVISLGILIGLYVLCSLAAAIYAAVKKLKKTLQENQRLVDHNVPWKILLAVIKQLKK